MNVQPNERPELRERVRARMASEGIPVGTDDPTLLALGGTPLPESADTPRPPKFSYWWKFVHNAVIHPLLSTPWEPRWLTRAHDWTADRCQGAG